MADEIDDERELGRCGELVEPDEEEEKAPEPDEADESEACLRRVVFEWRLSAAFSSLLLPCRAVVRRGEATEEVDEEDDDEDDDEIEEADDEVEDRSFVR